MPLSADAVSGLINLRGQIVMAMDLRKRLGIQERQDGQPPMNVVVRTNDGLVSLLVDDIGDVIEVDETMLESPPETMQGVARDAVCGVYKLDERLLLALDIDRVVEWGKPNAASQS